MLKSLLRKKQPVPSGNNQTLFEQVWLCSDIQTKMLKIKDILIDNTADMLAEELCKRFLKLVWFLPASEGHHHAKEFGLYLHSMETAIEALNQFDKKIYFEYRDNKGDIDSFETRRKRPHAQYAHFAAGMLHDVGKVVMYEVASGGEIWSPSREGLYDFVSRNPGLSFSSVRHKQFEYFIHQKIAPYFASLLFENSDFEYIGVEDIGDILNAIGYKPYTDNKFMGIVRADMASTGEDLKTGATQKDIVGEFLTVLRDMFKSGQIPINSIGAKAWIFEQFTAISVAVVDQARQILASKDRRVPETKIIWNMLRDRQVVDHEDWNCVYAMRMSDSVGRPFDVKVIKFRNNMLWGDEKRPDICTGRYDFQPAGASQTKKK